MNFKIFAVALFALFAALSFSSALSMSVSNDISMGQNATITLVSGENFNQTVTLTPTSPYTDGSGVVYSFPASIQLNQSQSRQIVINASSVPSSLKLGRYTWTLTAHGVDLASSSNTSQATAGITFDKGFCRSGTIGQNLTITSVDIKGSGSDDTTWTLLDTVRVKVRVENTGEETVRGVNVVLGLFDSNGVNRAGDLKYSSSDEDKVNYGSIKSGNDESITFDFQVPADFNSGDYKLAVKAYSSNAGEDKLCSDTSSDLDNLVYQTVNVETESTKAKYIAFDNTQLTPAEATCGDTVTLATTAYNIGDNDEDRVKVNIASDQLHLSDSVEFTNGLAMGESAPATFSFTVPQNTKDGLYLINLFADYEYKDGLYMQRSSNFATSQLKVIGCGTTPGSSGSGAASINAALSSDVAAGQPLAITTTITNLGSSQNTYTVDASGYDSWATLSSQSDRAIVLNPGQSKQVTFNLNVNKAVSGQQSLTVNARTAQTVDSKNVVVTIPAASGFSLGGNSTIWIIAGINVVLLIIIIIVAVRLANR